MCKFSIFFIFFITVPLCEISFHCKKRAVCLRACQAVRLLYMVGGKVCAGQSPSDVLAVRTGVVGGGGGHVLKKVERL
jgi:hypothetical protein